jgi:ComF family protein
MVENSTSSTELWLPLADEDAIMGHGVDAKKGFGSRLRDLPWSRQDSLAGLLKRVAVSTARRATNVIYPPSCIGCGKQSSAQAALCFECWPSMRFIEHPVCAVYGTPFAVSLGEGAVSARAIAEPPPFQRARAAVSYEGPAVPLVHGLKFADRLDHAPWMASWMMRAASELLQDTDIILPVPLHWRRRLGRRFNQSAELGKALAKLSGKPFAADVLARVKNTETQRGLSAAARVTNVQAAFKVPEAVKIKVAGRRILLVDDVITTGATVSACTRALMKAGAASVDVLAFAMALKPGVDV